jgi:tripartite-type tricarboxylate transporter receptor subunit TctC
MKGHLFIAVSCLAVFGLMMSPLTLQAQTYPNRNIQLVIPNVPGSIMDINSRAVSEELGKLLGTQIIPINKAGAGTVVGTEAVARSKKDGYTIGYMSNAAMVYARILNPETFHFDPDKDIEPLGLHILFANAFSVQASSPWKTFNEVLDYAKKNPGKLRVGTMGVGSVSHFSLEVIQSLTGTQFTHIPFKGGEAVTAAILGGHVEITFDAVVKYVPHVESGALRILLLTHKLPAYPQWPTLSDLGYNQELFSSWFAFCGPSGLPEEVNRTLIPAIEKVIKHPEFKDKFEKMHYVVPYKSPAELKRMIAEEYGRALEIAKKVGLSK